MTPLCAFAKLALMAGGIGGIAGAVGIRGQEAPPPRQEPQAAQRAQAGQESKIDYSKKWDEVIMVPDDVGAIAEKALPYIPPTAIKGLAPSDDQYGMRSFGINVLPGQTLRATVHANPVGRYFINFSIPKDAEGPLFSEIRNARTVQAKLKRPFIELDNTTGSPFLLRFFLIGPEENNYSIKLERKKSGG